MIFNEFPYINIPEKTDFYDMIKFIFCDYGKNNTYTLVCSVAKRNVSIAIKYGLDVEKCRIAGLLHDISCVIKPIDMLSYAKIHCWDLCEAEEKYPFLLHQRLSSVVADEFFNISDEKILSSIRCHTTLKANPTAYDMALFVADKLSWDQEGTPPFYDEVNLQLENSLENACFAYMKFMTENNKVLFPHENWRLAFEWLKKICDN